MRLSFPDTLPREESERRRSPNPKHVLESTRGSIVGLANVDVHEVIVIDVVEACFGGSQDVLDAIAPHAVWLGVAHRDETARQFCRNRTSLAIARALADRPRQPRRASDDPAAAGVAQAGSCDAQHELSRRGPSRASAEVRAAQVGFTNAQAKLLCISDLLDVA